MKNKNAIMVRYTGSDWHRTYRLQRGDFKYWTCDGGWSHILDMAKVFHDYTTAGTTAAALVWGR